MKMSHLLIMPSYHEGQRLIPLKRNYTDLILEQTYLILIEKNKNKKQTIQSHKREKVLFFLFKIIQVIKRVKE